MSSASRARATEPAIESSRRASSGRVAPTTTGGGPYLLKTQMGAGHAGRSARYDAWRDEAEVLAFVLTRTGAVPAP
ncbi:MAG: hypothetical protein WD010_06125 [Nitriliruptor sp.]